MKLSCRTLAFTPYIFIAFKGLSLKQMEIILFGREFLDLLKIISYIVEGPVILYEPGLGFFVDI